MPLLERVLATAVRAGVKDLILFWPADADPAIWDQCVTSRALQGLQTHIIRGLPFDPRESGNWAAISSLLNDEFLWLPWNFVTAARSLKAVKTSAVPPLELGKTGAACQRPDRSESTCGYRHGSRCRWRLHTFSE